MLLESEELVKLSLHRYGAQQLHTYSTTTLRLRQCFSLRATLSNNFL